MDAETRRTIHLFATQIANMQSHIERLERGLRATQLGFSSVEGGYIDVNDDEGNLRTRIGRQGDGLFGLAHYNGPLPPAPSAPVVTPDTLGLSVAWDGTFTAARPSDFAAVQVRISSVSGVTGPVAATLTEAGQVSVSPLPIEPQFVVLTAVSTSGVVSAPSAEVSATPQEVVATDILDGIVDTLALADDAVTEAKIAADAVGTAEIQGQAVDLSKLADGSVDATKILFNARDIGSVTTFRQDAEPTGTIVATNLVINPSFEVDLTPWSESGCTIERSDEWSQFGSWSMKVTSSGSSGRCHVDFETFDIVAGETYTGSFYVFAPASLTTGVELWLAWSDETGSVIRFDMSANVDPTGESVRLDYTAIAPEGADSVELQLSMPSGQTASDVVYLDGALFTEGSELYDYFDDQLIEGELQVADLWYDTANGNKVYRWDGSTWQPVPMGTNAIADDAIIAAKVAAEAIGANELAANSVVAGKLAADSVETNNIVAGAVQTAQIAADAVAAGKIAADAVTAREIAALAVTADELAANAVTAGKIEAGAIDAGKLAALIVIASRLVAGDPAAARVEINASGISAFDADGNETVAIRSDGSAFFGGDLGADTVGGEQLVAGSITAAELSLGHGLSGNLCLDPSFEGLIDTTGDVGEWEHASEFVAQQPRTGSRALRAVNVPVGDTYTHPVVRAAPVSGTSSFTVAWWGNSASGAEMGHRIEYLDSGGAVIDWAIVYHTVQVSRSWTRNQDNHVAPTGTVAINVTLNVRNTIAGEPVSPLFDDVWVVSNDANVLFNESGMEIASSANLSGSSDPAFQITRPGLGAMVFDDNEIRHVNPDGSRGPLFLNTGSLVRLGSGGRDIGGVDFGRITLDTNSLGKIFVPHTLGVTPSVVSVLMADSNAALSYATWIPSQTGPNNIALQIRAISNGAALGGGNTTSIMWIAFA